MCFWDSWSDFIGQTFDAKLLRKIQIFGISDLGKDFNILRKWWRREARQRCLSSFNDAPWRSGPSWLRFHKDLKRGYAFHFVSFSFVIGLASLSLASIWETVRMGGNLVALNIQACFSKFLDHYSSSLAPTTPWVPHPSVGVIESVCFTLWTQKTKKNNENWLENWHKKLHRLRKGWNKHISAQLETLWMIMRRYGKSPWLPGYYTYFWQN